MEKSKAKTFGFVFLLLFLSGLLRFAIKQAIFIVARQTHFSDRMASMAALLKAGWKAVAEKRGVLLLSLLSSAITCFMGAFQILAGPMILAFSDSTTLGICETICASGMLVSGLFPGIRGIRKGYVKRLSLSLVIAGAAMVVFGLRENLILRGSLTEKPT